MQTFMYCFYKHTHLIKNEIKNNEDARKKSYHCIDDEYTDTERSVIDVGGSISLNNYLPPYAAFYVDRTNSNNQSSNQGKEIAWPERIGGVHAEKLQEVRFINSLLTGSETYEEVTTNLNIDSTSSGSSIIDGINTEINGFIPVTVYDFACKDNTINPYIKAKEAINMGEENTLEAVILSTFALRAFYANKVSSKHSDVIGFVEALNLFNALKTNNSISFVKFIKKYLTGNIGAAWVAFRNLITETAQNNINSLWMGNNKTPLFTSSSYNTRTFNNYQTTTNYLIYSYNNTIFPIGTTNFKQINFPIKNVADALSHSSVNAAFDLAAKAIVVCTKTGKTAMMVSRFRPEMPIIAFVTNDKAYHQLSMSWAVSPFLMDEYYSTEELSIRAIDRTKAMPYIKKNDIVIVVAGIARQVNGSNLMRIEKIR
jgi:hypothetical protein